MAAFVSKLKLHKCCDLISAVDTITGKVICFARVQNECLLLCVVDACVVWMLAVDKAKAEQMLNSCTPPLSDIETFLLELRSAFVSHNLTVGRIASVLSLRVGKLDFELRESNAADNSAHLQYILLRLAEHNIELETQLSAANKTIDNLHQQQKSADSATARGGIFDTAYDAKKKKTLAKSAPKQPGMSVINPGSKKRAAPKGVEFK